MQDNVITFNNGILNLIEMQSFLAIINKRNQEAIFHNDIFQVLLVIYRRVASF